MPTEQDRLKREVNEKKWALTERVKELNCLYQVSSILNEQYARPLDFVLRQVIVPIAEGMQHPEQTGVSILLHSVTVQSAGYSERGPALTAPVMSEEGEAGTITIRYLEMDSDAGDEDPFLTEEHSLIQGLAFLLGDVAERIRSRQALEAKASELERKNIALRELLSQLEQEKQNIGRDVKANLEVRVIPVLKRLGNADLPHQTRLQYVRVVEHDLRDITSSFGQHLTHELSHLTPRETELCNLIRAGMSNKEMANMLGLSIATIERHRHNIRSKLGIQNSGVNLSTFLNRNSRS